MNSRISICNLFLLTLALAFTAISLTFKPAFSEEYQRKEQYIVRKAKIISIATQQNSVLLILDKDLKRSVRANCNPPSGYKGLGRRPNTAAIYLDDRKLTAIRYSLALAAFTSGRLVDITSLGPHLKCEQDVYARRLDIQVHD